MYKDLKGGSAKDGVKYIEKCRDTPVNRERISPPAGPLPTPVRENSGPKFNTRVK
jgi:hypothetical protein